ncbi:flavodoxin family protein [Planomonospora parontospora]|uniref:flavodoxin family protein n=1 Tax=Planomonospora parontospora TaxID=58119 RepID=UPI0019916F92|nr:flavodoxin domain-containing protein [Planomonospora parontospora]GGL13977.1 flavodoxin [Planomonospora parontospora subsp. antibiotica]GII17895.1 flavodoxin [Planomonospora parontospora subsp. antibiotica]
MILMRALVVFESMFGNTQAIAEAVADGLATHMRVDLIEVGDAPATVPGDVDLLVVGAPTHAFGMSRPATRQSAAQQTPAGLVSKGRGLREWLATLDDHVPAVAAAAFDTRVKNPWVPGSARHGADKRLRRKGFAILSGSQSFYVSGTPGPLLEGETDRARYWGTALATARQANAHRIT